MQTHSNDIQYSCIHSEYLSLFAQLSVKFQVNVCRASAVCGVFQPLRAAVRDRFC